MAINWKEENQAHDSSPIVAKMTNMLSFDLN